MSMLSIKSKRLIATLVGTFALLIGATSASAATMWYIHQPKCPKHLLK